MSYFDNSYARLPERMFAAISPAPVADPEVVLFNDALAAELGLNDWAMRADVLSGNVIPDGADPIAQAYAGHQFGGWVPQLGDGRAVLLGEIVSDTGRFDIQLKGAGRTPFSRNGDGRAWLGPVLREYLVSEFMAACGVPTTRALAAVTTGERVQRERTYPGAILTRVAASHIRVGTFQYFTARNDQEAIRNLIEQTRTRHYPDAETALDVYGAIVTSQAELVAKWAGLGFVHGVMNTDNMAVSGETIDYGPCAFIDAYRPNAVYSSIDQFGRYAYDQQATVAQWNLAQLGSCFVAPVADEMNGQDEAIEALNAALTTFAETYQATWTDVFAAKIGMRPSERSLDLAQRLLTMMGEQGADFTNTFRGLADGSARDWFTDRAAFDTWAEAWTEATGDTRDVIGMQASNPAVIPRTHRLEQAIEAAVEGDFAPTKRLEGALMHPFDVERANRDLTRPPSEDEIVPRTFCGT